MEGATGCTAGEESDSTFGRSKRGLVSRVLQVFSAVESSINGPHAGPDHRNRGSKDRHYDCGKRMRRARKEHPDANDGNRDSGDWRPKAEQQEYARDSGNQIWEARRESIALNHMRGSVIDQNRAREHALKQKTSSGPALRKCGKQTLQTRPPMLVRC